MRIHHLNGGTLHPATGRLSSKHREILERGEMVCHCLLVELPDGLMLADTGIGLVDIAVPLRRLGPAFLALMRPELDAKQTLARQVEALGHRREDVRHVVLTHLDPEHAGGLADFSEARVHLLAAEYRAAAQTPRWLPGQRYRSMQWAHGPHLELYFPSGPDWFGFPAVADLRGLPPEVRLVSLPGHSPGHAGIALKQNERWLLLAGDALLHPIELPALQQQWERLPLSLDPAATTRQSTATRLKALGYEHPGEVTVFSSHDASELEACQRQAGPPA